jgi:hypothetical protein
VGDGTSDAGGASGVVVGPGVVAGSAVRSLGGGPAAGSSTEVRGAFAGRSRARSFLRVPDFLAFFGFDDVAGSADRRGSPGPMIIGRVRRGAVAGRRALGAGGSCVGAILARSPYPCPMPPTWFWMQVLLVACVLVSMVIAGIKLWA